MSKNLMSNEQVANWFGKRAGGLLYSTTDELAGLGLAPICLTSSFAQNTGELHDRCGALKALPLVAEAERLPVNLAERMISHYRRDGQDLVLPGELGGITDQSEYGLVELAEISLYDTLVRVSCRGTVYRFTRHPGGWTMTRTEA